MNTEQPQPTTEAAGSASDVERVVRLARDYAKAGCVFSIYQNDGAGLWHKRGEIEGRDIAKMFRAMELALYALEEVTFFSGPDDMPAKVEGTYSDAVDCNMAINALRKFVVPNVEFSGATQLHRGASAGTKG